jgi:hypothetical protein
MLMLMSALTSTAGAQFQWFAFSKSHTILHSSSQIYIDAVPGVTPIVCSLTKESTSTGSHVALLGFTRYRSSTLPTTFTYSKCKDVFERTVDADNSGLTYTFTTNGTAHLSGGMTLTVTSSGSVVCTIVIASPQTNNGISYHNLGGTSGLRLTMNSTDLITTTSGGFFNCGVSNGEHQGGTIEVDAVITGVGTDGGASEVLVE